MQPEEPAWKTHLGLSPEAWTERWNAIGKRVAAEVEKRMRNASPEEFKAIGEETSTDVQASLSIEWIRRISWGDTSQLDAPPEPFPPEDPLDALDDHADVLMASTLLCARADMLAAALFEHRFDLATKAIKRLPLSEEDESELIAHALGSILASDPEEGWPLLYAIALNGRRGKNGLRIFSETLPSVRPAVIKPPTPEIAATIRRNLNTRGSSEAKRDAWMSFFVHTLEPKDFHAAAQAILEARRPWKEFLGCFRCIAVASGLEIAYLTAAKLAVGCHGRHPDIAVEALHQLWSFAELSAGAPFAAGIFAPVSVELLEKIAREVTIPNIQDDMLRDIAKLRQEKDG